jgi:hypothetical protein
VARGQDRLSVEVLVNSRKFAQERALAGTVKTKYSYLGAVEIGKMDVLQHWFLVIILGDTDHGINYFSCFIGHGLDNLLPSSTTIIPLHPFSKWVG